MTAAAVNTEQDLLQVLRDKGRNLRYCVVGAGHGGLAMAGHLGLMGFEVCLYNRTEENLNGVRWHGGVKVDGAVTGFGPIAKATTDMGEALANADVVMIVTPATAHRSLAALMAPHLHDGQIVVLNPGRTGGTLEVCKVFRDSKVKARVFVGETSTFIYASRAASRSEAYIYRIKNSVPLATMPVHHIPHVLGVLNMAFPQFVAGTSVLSTSMENIGAIFHPALTLLNAGWIEATGGDFDYYRQGITPTIASILESIDAERMAVATSLGVHTVSAREWLYLSYDSPGKDLHEAVQNTDSYRGIRAPSNIIHRYIFEDVPMSLVPLSSIGALMNVPTPMIDTIIRLASVAHGKDYRAEGRTVETMGLSGLTLKEIRHLVIGA
ncbi:MAG: NADP transhydrogenase subunit alpha [Verrucomicrobia bacterium]|nr:NADP transhydrogenase subunit alpha [Verrucomicrobiota bacterium]